MELDFVNIDRYENIEQIIYEKVKEYKPNTIVELGFGSGALTVAMALGLKEINPKGKIHTYDNFSDKRVRGVKGLSKTLFTETKKRIKIRNLDKYVNLIVGDVFEKWVDNPFDFDLLIIDINNTWDDIYKITVDNKFIYNKIKKGAKVFIEGGDPNHPRINQDTLNEGPFKQTFSFKHLGGSKRTSISKLEILI
mgnify:CR=1 FL=1